MPTLGIYIQFPFCASKCSFCNFSSQVAPARVLDAYCQALEREIECLPQIYEAEDSELSGGADAGLTALLALPVDTVYLGGGTPSLAGAARLKQIWGALTRRFRLLDSHEFTVELTPGSADVEYLTQARSLGVNRLSLGAQSFDERELRSVGRLAHAHPRPLAVGVLVATAERVDDRPGRFGSQQGDRRAAQLS